MKRTIPILVLFVACQASKTEDTTVKVGGETIKIEQPQLAMKEIAASFNVTVQNAARRINAGSDDPEARRMTILWQMRVSDVCQRALQQKDVRWTLLDLWGFAYQQHNFFSTGPGKDLFGAQQPFALQATESLVADFDTRMNELVSQEVVDAARQDVQRFAEDYPIEGRTLRRAHRPHMAHKSGNATFNTILKLPQKVFTIGGGVKDTAQSISEVAQVADRFTDVVDSLPTETRWQTELLLLDLDQNASMRSALEDWHRVATAIGDIAKTADEMPGKVTAELEETLTKFDAQQAGLQKTMVETRAVVEETRATVNDARTTLATASKTVETVEEASKALAAAGKAWEPTARELNLLVNPPPDPDSEPGPPLDMKDVVKAAANLTDAAVELRKLVEELNGLVDSDGVSKRLRDVDRTAQSAVDHTTARAVDLTDAIMWRAIAVIGAFFVALLGYKVVASKL